MLKIAALCISFAYALHGGGALLQDEITPDASPLPAKMVKVGDTASAVVHTETVRTAQTAMMEVGNAKIASVSLLASDLDGANGKGSGVVTASGDIGGGTLSSQVPSPSTSTTLNGLSDPQVLGRPVHGFSNTDIGLVAGGGIIFALGVWVWFFRTGSVDDGYKRTSVRHSTLRMIAGDLSCVVEESSNLGEGATDGSKESLITDGGKAESKMSTTAASMSLVTVMIGAGVLALPKVVATCGWYLAGPMIVGAGLVNMSCCHTLIDCIDRASQRRPIDQFKDIAHVAFGPVCASLADLVFLVFLASMIAVYIVLIADNLNFLLPWAKRPWILATGMCVMGTALIKDVSVLGKLAFIGVLASIVYAVSIIGGGIAAAETYTNRVHSDVPSASVGAIVGKFCVLMFGFCCCDCLTSFRSEMEKPAELPKAVNQAHLATASVYLAVGYVGYWGWGTHVSGNILDSMCQMPGCVGSGEPALPQASSGDKMMLGYVLAVAVVSNLVVSLPFSAFVLFKAIEGKFQTFQNNASAAYTMRMSTVVILTCAGIMIPFFMEMLDLVSAVLIVAICMLFPTSFAMKLDYDDGKTFNKKTPIHLATFAFGVVAMYLGVTEAWASLMDAAAANPNAMNPFRDFFGQAGTI